MQSASFGARSPITVKERLSYAGERTDVMNAVLSRSRFVVFAASSALAAWPKWAHGEGAFIQDAAWSPDGTELLFSKGDVRGPMHLFLIRSDGSALRQITSGASVNVFGAWSPDGTRIAFRSNRDGANELYLMQPDGSNIRRLTFGGAHQYLSVMVASRVDCL